jgi:hypothetical protein
MKKKFKLELFCAGNSANLGGEVRSKVLHTFTGDAPSESLLAIVAANPDIAAAEKEIIGHYPNFYAAVKFGNPVHRDTITLRYNLQFS